MRGTNLGTGIAVRKLQEEKGKGNKHHGKEYGPFFMEKNSL